MKKDVRITARVPPHLRLLMQRYVRRDAHLNESDLIRDSIREKIQQDAPTLYAEFLRANTTKQKGMER